MYLGLQTHLHTLTTTNKSHLVSLETSKKLAATLSMATHLPRPLTPLSPPSLGQPTESQSPSPPMPRPLSTRRFLPRDERPNWPRTLSMEQWAEPMEPHPTPSTRLRPLICRQQVPTRSTCMHLSMSPVSWSHPSTPCSTPSLTNAYSPPKPRPLWPHPLGVWPSSLTTMYRTIHLHRHLWSLLKNHYRTLSLTELPPSLMCIILGFSLV